jgi:hypothetical protein
LMISSFPDARSEVLIACSLSKSDNFIG